MTDTVILDPRHPMNTKTYCVTYADALIAIVTIEPIPCAQEALIDMVQFWSGWEKRLSMSKGDIIECWLKQLAKHILYERKLPDEGDEGWCPLDGSWGITVKLAGGWVIDEEEIGVTEEVEG